MVRMSKINEPSLPHGRPHLQVDATPQSLSSATSHDNMLQHRRALKLVDDDLETRDLQSIKFLCSDFVATMRQERITRGIELFDELEKQGSISSSDVQLIAECLQATDRLDLLRHIHFTKASLMSAMSLKGRKIPIFRLLLHSIAQDMTGCEVDALKFLLRGHTVARKKLDEASDAYDLFTVLLQPGLISSDNVAFLVDLMSQIGRVDLSDFVRQYSQENIRGTDVGRLSEKSLPREIVGTQQATAPQLSKHEPAASPLDMLSSLVAASAVVGKPSLKTTFIPEQLLSLHPPGVVVDKVRELVLEPAAAVTSSAIIGPSHQPSVVSRKLEEERDLPSYPMLHSPRGLCIIINNTKFHHVPGDPESRPEMKDRPGSSRDVMLLVAVFSKLGFAVTSFVDLPSQQLVRRLRDAADADHSRYDAFVCCVLTHGIEGQVYGSDSRLVPIKDLTSPFVARQCRTLSGKPKLFFLQACQGKMKQQGALPALETDSNDQEVERGLIPDEADFLIGYATVPGYVSFRSPTHGAWYIRKLTEMLSRYGDRYDLMSILTIVNDEVSKGDAQMQDEQGFQRYKQMPAPMTTLRKRLYFPPLPL